MGTKTISITEDAYKILVSLKKRENESFSEVIRGIKQKTTLKDIYGILKGKVGEELEKNIMESRKIHSELHEKRHKRLMKEFE